MAIVETKDVRIVAEFGPMKKGPLGSLNCCRLIASDQLGAVKRFRHVAAQEDRGTERLFWGHSIYKDKTQFPPTPGTWTLYTTIKRGSAGRHEQWVINSGGEWVKGVPSDLDDMWRIPNLTGRVL